MREVVGAAHGLEALALVMHRVDAVNVRPGPYLPTVPTIYQRKVTLKGSHPPIWRRLVVAEKLNFERPQPARPRPASKPRAGA